MEKVTCGCCNKTLKVDDLILHGGGVYFVNPDDDYFVTPCCNSWYN